MVFGRTKIVRADYERVLVGGSRPTFVSGTKWLRYGAGSHASKGLKDWLETPLSAYGDVVQGASARRQNAQRGAWARLGASFSGWSGADRDAWAQHVPDPIDTSPVSTATWVAHMPGNSDRTNARPYNATSDNASVRFRAMYCRCFVIKDPSGRSTSV